MKYLYVNSFKIIIILYWIMHIDFNLWMIFICKHLLQIRVVTNSFSRNTLMNYD